MHLINQPGPIIIYMYTINGHRCKKIVKKEPENDIKPLPLPS